MRLKIALRNVFRNGRRTLLNILMLAGGMTAIILFRGFCDKILLDLREVTIQTQTGHLQVATRVFWEKEDENPGEALLNDYQTIVKVIESVPRVKNITGRISFFGLVGKGERTYSARGVSIDPNAENEKVTSYRIIEGQPLTSEKSFQILLGSGLAKRLKAKAGETVTVLAYTYEGVVNALDLEVGAIINTTISEFDDTTFLIPLTTAQSLLNTDKVAQVIVWLDKTEEATVTALTLGNQLREKHPNIVVKEWNQLAGYYQKAVTFFSTQNRVLEVIVTLLVLLGILNTVGMSIMERTAEIGTVRALGDSEATILIQFILEGAILGVIGAVFGMGLGTAIALSVRSLNIPLEIPGASIPIPIGMELLLETYRDAFFLVVAASIIASVIPAFKASRLNIVDALRRAV